MRYIVFLSLFLYACGGTIIESYDEDGLLYERYNLNKDSIRHGTYERFFKNQNIAEKANYVDGKLHGKRTLYFSKKGIEIEEVYSMDSLHGSYTAYYPSGKVEIVQEYQNNKIQGIAKRYYESGQLMEEVLFKDNEENGPFTEYYENGQVEWKGQYLNGDNEFGLLENFDPNGVLIKKMMCDSLGVCKTIWTKDQQDETE